MRFKLRRMPRLAAVCGSAASLSAHIALVSLIALVACGKNPSDQVAEGGGGGGSEAVALTGTAVYPDQKPAAYARVRLRPKLYLPDTSSNPGAPATSHGGIDTVTDGKGQFHIDSVSRGEYFLQISDSASQGVLVPCTLTGDSAVVNLSVSTLKPTGTVTGTIVPPAGFTGQSYVQVYGLDNQVRTDSATGKFNMDGLPEGTYTLRAVYSAPAVDPREVPSVQTKALDTTDIGALKLASFENEIYESWPFSQRIYINTSGLGALATPYVDDFPLLVRLNKGNFDFSKSHGDDLRFANSKGQRLRYEVERWDSAGAQAEVWVRVDRIYFGSNTQFITMCWGAADVPSWSDGRLVFGVDNGFGGVWHLDEEAPDTAATDVYKDAVGYDPADDKISSTDRSGIIGRGHHFDVGDYIIVPVANPLLEPNSKVTVSAWVRSKKTSLHGAGVLSMSDNYNLRINPDGSGRFSLFDGETRKVESATRVLLDSTWHMLSASYDGNTLTLYIDGLVSATAVYAGVITYNNWPSFVIGRHGNHQKGYDFIGDLDELEVSIDMTRSAEWIRLSFENQKANSTLLEFRP